MIFPGEHPLRRELNDEVHARPPEALAAPMRISFLALFSPWAEREAERRHVALLAQRYGADPPGPDASHFSVSLGEFRFKWERHAEFTRYKFMVPGCGPDAFAAPAVASVPADWLAGIPGQTLAAGHVALTRGQAFDGDDEELAAHLFEGHVLVGAGIAGGAGRAFTDFRIHADGFGRFVVEDHGLTHRQAGRMVQRLVEIDSYRMLALMALPVARELTPFLAARERDLADVATTLAAGLAQDEPELLMRLTRLEAEIESREAANHFRFTAAVAYEALVRRRIEELREERIRGLQMFREFIERRMAPAMATCRTAASRQEALAERVARATQLLATRVALTRELQTQTVLVQMNRRARLQLRLQQTVEGLSVAAVSYYVVGLVAYAAKGLKTAGLPVEPDLVVAVAIPVVALLVWLGVRRIHRMVAHDAH